MQVPAVLFGVLWIDSKSERSVFFHESGKMLTQWVLLYACTKYTVCDSHRMFPNPKRVCVFKAVQLQYDGSMHQTYEVPFGSMAKENGLVVLRCDQRENQEFYTSHPNFSCNFNPGTPNSTKKSRSTQLVHQRRLLYVRVCQPFQKLTS